MRIKEPQFYRKAGIRTRGELMRPRLIPQRHLILPLESILHFNPVDGVAVGPSPQDSLLDNLGGRLYIQHVMELTQRDGNPRRTVVNPTMLQNEYRRKTRGFRPLRKDAALVINPRNVLVVNYGMLNPLYRYIPSFKASYFRWANLNHTFWSSVADVHARFKWNQYIELQLPDTLPGLEQFLIMERNGATPRTLSVFDTPAVLNLMDVWWWLSNTREKSAMSVLDKEALARVNFIVRLKGYFFVVNLGVLDGWRLDKDDEDSKGMDATVMQRRVYKLWQSLMELKAGTETIEAQVDDTDADPATDVTITRAVRVGPGKLDSTLLPEVDDIPAVIQQPPTPPVITRLPSVPTQDGEDADTRYIGSETEHDPVAETEDTPTIDTRMADAIQSAAWDLHEAGVLSANAFKRAQIDASTYKTLRDPFGSGRTIAEAMVLDPEDLELPDVPAFRDRATVPDKSMLRSKLKFMTRKYVEDVLQKDVLNAVMAIQQQGVAVKDWKMEVVRDAMNHYQIHRVTVKPVRGRQSTVVFRLPVVDKDGRFMSNGTTYALRAQRADVPIRKIHPGRVALTSYYNKTFVDRSTRKTNDFEHWLAKEITKRGLDPEDPSVSDMRLSDVFDKSLYLPRSYSMLAKTFIRFNTPDYQFYFKYADRGEYFGVDPATVETANMVLVGKAGTDYVLVDHNEIFYRRRGEDLEPIGPLLTLLGIEASRAPMDIAEMTVANKMLPVGVVLAYHLGLSKLLELLGCEVTRYNRGERVVMSDDDYRLTFQDEVLVLSRLDRRSTMLLAGLDRFHRVLKSYPVHTFDKKDVYGKVLDSVNMGARYLRAIDNLFLAWVDPITLGLLESMGEPTDFQGLLFRSVELLLTDQSPEEVDGAYMRYRGYERMAGMLYGELSKSIRAFKAQVSTGENTVEMNPHAVWQRIVTDPAVSPIKESNPIQDLREQEAMTFRGDGGRSGRSMVQRTRVFHSADKGVVTESTVDSGDVGVVAYLSPDANFTSLRGTTRAYDPQRDGMASLFSTSALLAPCGMNDHMRRLGFCSIQQAQGIFADGYRATPLKTGYEQIVAQRTTGLFSTVASKDGIIRELTDDVLVVEYRGGKEERIQLGKRFGNAAGKVYPHELVTDYKVGDKVKAGDVLVYNRKFFEPDVFNRGQVWWKAGVLARTALMDTIDTLEDGSVISEDLAKRLNSQLTEVRTIEVRFEQSIRDLVKPGDHVDIDSILCIIEDPEIANVSVFDATSLDTLRRVSAMTPRAKVHGVVQHIECFYHGDIEDLSESLRAIATASDKARRSKAKALGEPSYTGQVDTSFRVKGKALDPDVMAIQIYIDHDVSASAGDKAVFGNQLKTTFSRVMYGVNRTASGEPLDGIFGNTSIEERMVGSPKLMGTTNTLLRVLSKHIVAVYRGEADAKAKA